MRLLGQISSLCLVWTAAFVLPSSVRAELVQGDALKGQQVFKKCSSCHMVGEDVRNRVGPPLNNIIDVRAGLVADFKYSKALKMRLLTDCIGQLKTLMRTSKSQRRLCRRRV